VEEFKEMENFSERNYDVSFHNNGPYNKVDENSSTEKH